MGTHQSATSLILTSSNLMGGFINKSQVASKGNKKLRYHTFFYGEVDIHDQTLTFSNLMGGFKIKSKLCNNQRELRIQNSTNFLCRDGDIRDPTNLVALKR
jgi:hypothetical protein